MLQTLLTPERTLGNGELQGRRMGEKIPTTGMHEVQMLPILQEEQGMTSSTSTSSAASSGGRRRSAAEMGFGIIPQGIPTELWRMMLHGLERGIPHALGDTLPELQTAGDGTVGPTPGIVLPSEFHTLEILTIVGGGGSRGVER